MRITQLYLSILIASTSTYALAATEAFKCTEADGKISYLDTRPTTGCVTIEVVRVNVGKGTSIGKQQESTDTSADSTAADSKEALTPAEEKEIAEKKAAIKKDCDLQKKNLETLKTKTYIQTKGEDGKLRTVPPEEQQKMIKDTQERIEGFCK